MSLSHVQVAYLRGRCLSAHAGFISLDASRAWIVYWIVHRWVGWAPAHNAYSCACVTNLQ